MTNRVEVVGRLGGRVTQRELPSGDIATGFAVIVDRPASDQVGTTKVDTMPCQTFRESVAKKVLAMEPGTQVSCMGVLRRRFWRSSGGLASALEIEVRALKRET
jgi:single-stranded DNA-binding protein